MVQRRLFNIMCAKYEPIVQVIVASMVANSSSDLAVYKDVQISGLIAGNAKSMEVTISMLHPSANLTPTGVAATATAIAADLTTAAVGNGGYTFTVKRTEMDATHMTVTFAFAV